MAGGRPTTYTIEIAKKICELVASTTKSVASIAKEVGVPYSTVMDWLSDHKEFSDLYGKAKTAQADFLFDQLLEIADDKSGDILDREDGPSANNANVNRSKLQVDTRKWILARLNARKYGEKQITDNTTQMNVTISKEEANDIKKALENDI